MEISSEQFRALLGSLKSDKPGPKDARRQPRVGLRGMISVLQMINRIAVGRPSPVRLVNVSAGGMSFLFPRELPLGDHLEIRLTDGVKYDSFCVLIRHCRRTSQGVYSIGVEFLEESAKAASTKPAKTTTAA